MITLYLHYILNRDMRYIDIQKSLITNMEKLYFSGKIGSCVFFEEGDLKVTLAVFAKE